jgi:hypothetical protein
MAGATPLPNSPQVQALRKIGATDEEIADVLACDKAIDQGANLFPLDPELEAGAKKARRADRTDTPKPRERKPNEDRQFLLRVLVKALENHDDEGFGTEFQSEIINPEREFLFTYNGTKYKVVLSAPRS